MTTTERFGSKWTPEPNTGCWLWTSSVNWLGYGRFGQRGAHRVAYELYVGPIPEGMTLDHLCRVRSCVNPDHLEPVTLRENIYRGSGVGVINAAKTHCKQGHRYDADNTYWRPEGGRHCKACRRAAVTRFRSSQKAIADV